MTDLEPCARKCVHPRQHANTCPDTATCAGCQPREAKYGLLCQPCHKRLTGWLKDAPFQHLLLRMVEDPDMSQGLGALIGAVDVDAPAPLNVDALTISLTLTDILSSWVEMLADQYHMTGPTRLSTQAGRFDPRPWPRWSYYAGETIWTYPPPRFEITAASRWLTAQLDRLETCPGISDLWAELRETMATAHQLAPWREQVTRVKGIECPCCHHMTLAHHGGESDVSCERCNEQIPPGRYTIWVRILAADKEKAEAG